MMLREREWELRVLNEILWFQMNSRLNTAEGGFILQEDEVQLLRLTSETKDVNEIKSVDLDTTTALICSDGER